MFCNLTLYVFLDSSSHQYATIHPPNIYQQPSTTFILSIQCSTIQGCISASFAENLFVTSLCSKRLMKSFAWGDLLCHPLPLKWWFEFRTARWMSWSEEPFSGGLKRSNRRRKEVVRLWLNEYKKEIARQRTHLLSTKKNVSECSRASKKFWETNKRYRS